MKPNHDETDEWIDGLRGRRSQQRGTGFDALDARLAESLRRQQVYDERAVPDEVIARGRMRLERHVAVDQPSDPGATKGRSIIGRLFSPWPFATGAAVGLTMALVGLALIPALLREPTSAPPVSPPIAASRLTITVPSADPSSDESDLVATLLAGGIPFSVMPADPRAYSTPLPFDQREVILVYPESSSPALEAWFRERGVSPPPAGGEVRVLIRRRSAADQS